MLGTALSARALLPRLVGKSLGIRQPGFTLAADRGNGASPRTIGGGLPAPRPPAVSTAWAEQMFTAGRNKDFGAVPFGTKLFHQFPITNVHPVPVEITGLRVGCGCVKAAPAKRVLQPGESTTIDVTFDTRQFTGHDTQTIRVAVGPNPQSRCTLEVSADSQTDVLVRPSSIGFGRVEQGRTPAESVEIEHRGGEDWKIDDVMATGLPLEPKLERLPRQPGLAGYRLTVTLRADAPTGKLREYLYLRPNTPGAPLVPVLVTAIVEQRQDPTVQDSAADEPSRQLP
jgi:hypothetical protein